MILPRKNYISVSVITSFGLLLSSCNETNIYRYQISVNCDGPTGKFSGSTIRDAEITTPYGPFNFMNSRAFRTHASGGAIFAKLTGEMAGIVPMKWSDFPGFEPSIGQEFDRVILQEMMNAGYAKFAPSDKSKLPNKKISNIMLEKNVSVPINKKYWPPLLIFELSTKERKYLRLVDSSKYRIMSMQVKFTQQPKAIDILPYADALKKWLESCVTAQDNLKAHCKNFSQYSFWRD